MHNIYKIKNNSIIKKIKLYLLEKYSERFNIINFENMHNCLKNNYISDEDKNFYETSVALFGKTDRKSCFVKFFYNIFDKDYTILFYYIEFIKKEIKPLFPNEKYLVIQKTPNIRFHLVGYSNIGKRDSDISKDFIGVHYDGEFGHPETEINIILPLTDMFDTNSIYYEPTINSGIKYENYCNLNLKKDEFFMGYFNRCYHYNKINKTNSTRVSFDFRIIPYSKYKKSNNISATSKTKFELGKYYMLI